MIDLDTVSTYVVNLRRRPDRRTWIENKLPPSVRATFTSDLDVVTDGRELREMNLATAGIGLFDWQIDSANPWWNRPLKYGEIGCTLAHLACWRHALANTDTPYILVLEDDAEISPAATCRLAEALDEISSADVNFDLLYLGRYTLETDSPTEHAGIVRPGYSHCTFAYLMTRAGIETALDADLHNAIVPIDEFLPALYIPHPRMDLRQRFPPRLSALAFDPPLVTQRPKKHAGSDTEDSDFVEVSGSRQLLR